MAPSKIYGLVGYPVKHSFSPALHKAAFEYHNIAAEYRLFEVKPEDLKKFLLEDSNNLSGFNITIPHKVKAKQILEEKFPQDLLFDKEYALYYVKLTGAINTVKREGEKVEYRNTDAAGFLRALKEDLKFDPDNKNVILIGCGGAGRAVLAALSWGDLGTKKIYVYDINVEAIKSTQEHFLTLPEEWQKKLAQKIEFISKDQIQQKINKCQLLINASPIGMKEGESSAVEKELLHKDLAIYDVIYNQVTQLIKDAKSLGLKHAGGDNMLVYQGAAAFEFWTGKEAPIKIMRKAFMEAMNK